jgi:hypothetical protein
MDYRRLDRKGKDMVEGDGKRKLALAQVYLARLVMLGAPNKVILGMKDWCIELEKAFPVTEGESPGFKQGIGITDSTVVEMVDIGGKN